jgi:hypothetical protein
VDPLQIVRILNNKGFKPHRNTPFMQKIVAAMHFDQWRSEHPDFHTDVAEDRVLPDAFRQWVRTVVELGLDGEVVLEMLEDRGLRLTEAHTHFAQLLRGNELGPLVDRGSPVKVSEMKRDE